jgi:ABC-2 type transport system permease protein
MPLSFLSGTFYSVERLTGIWYELSHLNPFFYMIDGFRYGFIGTADSSLSTGMMVVGGMDIFLFLVVWFLFRTGFKLKA